MGCLSDYETRSKIGSYVAGLMFGVAWWMFIDAAVYSSHENLNISIDFVKYLPGIGTTLGLFLINTLDWGTVTADSSSYHGDNVACKARSFVIFCTLLSLGSLIGSIFILANGYVDNEFGESVWPGVAIFLQATLIFFATFLMKLFTIEE